jgi:F-type H+-transporting ATPase subunit c
MDVTAAKMIGAGIAAVALGGAGIGIGHIFGNYLAGALRNPAAAARGLIGFAVAMLILFG